jgi:hypothetical protein
LRSLWRRWAPASWQQKSSTGAPARLVLPFPLIFSRAAVMQLQEAHPAQHSFQRLARRVSRPPPPRLLRPQTQLLQQRLCPPVAHSDCIYRYRDSGGLDTKRGSEEHEQLLRSCGWAIRAEDMEVFLMAKDITGRQLLSSSWCRPPSLRKSSQGAAFPTQRQVRYGLQQRRQLSLGQAATVRPRLHAVALSFPRILFPRQLLQFIVTLAFNCAGRCEFCGDTSFCACACGTPYCSRLCQRSDWKGHRS